MRTIAAVTVGRSDFSIFLPVLQAIKRSGNLRLRLIVSGAHVSPLLGDSLHELEQQGLAADEMVEMLLASDTPQSISTSMGLGLIRFAEIYQRKRPDILLVLGDRFEMHAAATAAVPFKIPIAHIHGGEVTGGAIDDAFRHAITKYSHLHFVSTEDHARRVIQLGEQPWRVCVCGAPALDNLKTLEWLERPQLENRLGLKLDQAPLLVTYHPVTLQFDQVQWQTEQLLAAISSFGGPIIITRPNADTHHQTIVDLLEHFCHSHKQARLTDGLGTQGYFSLMRIAAAMVGNSSSGIIEAAALELPVVNVGIRQYGRARSANVLDVGNSQAEIEAGLKGALDPSFRKSLRGLRNVYGTGNAAEKIVARLEAESLDDRLLIKQFHDLP